MWTSVDLYQGWGGISRAMFLVRQGASKGLALFFPKMPPMTLKSRSVLIEDIPRRSREPSVRRRTSALLAVYCPAC